MYLVSHPVQRVEQQAEVCLGVAIAACAQTTCGRQRPTSGRPG
jgi:hypothetical protein